MRGITPPITIEEHNRVATTLCQQVRSLLDQLEKTGDAVARQECEEKILFLADVLKGYKGLISSEPPTKRDIWFRRHQSKQNDFDDLKRAFERTSSKRHPDIHTSTRDALFKGAKKTVQGVGHVLDEAASLARSSEMVSELQRQGVGVLGNLSEQRDTLKAARRKVLDVLNTLGVSKSLLNVIERRQTMDAYIVYAGIVLITLLLIWLLYYKLF